MNVLILGAAVSGLAAARLATDLGYEIVAYDRRLDAVSAFGDGVSVHTGEWRSGYLTDIDLVVTSPGFPEHIGPIPDVLERGVPIVSEMEFAVAHLDVPYAAVTGTNGKTTVTSVAADMLQASGIDAMAAGNIGTPLSELALDPPDVMVIEASSFQLRFVDQFHPHAAAILNVAPDHLDWHHDIGEYIAAKQQIFRNQTIEDVLAFDIDDAGAVAAVAPARAQLVPVSGTHLPPGGNGPQGETLVVSGEVLPRPQLDAAFTMDIVAAATLAQRLGATGTGIGHTIGGFVPGEHRRRIVGTWDGVTWVNDSKATNPHAAVASVSAYESVVLIAGGRNKGLDLAPIVAVPSVRLVIGIGEAADELAAAAAVDKFTDGGDLEHAIAIADEKAQPGDTVLLAPGCASFDMFDSYAARGEAFTRLVTRRKGAGNGN